jgi:hypothetical protein
VANEKEGWLSPVYQNNRVETGDSAGNSEFMRRVFLAESESTEDFYERPRGSRPAAMGTIGFLGETHGSTATIQANQSNPMRFRGEFAQSGDVKAKSAE